MVGDLNLTADFSAATLSGEATNFSEAEVTWDDSREGQLPEWTVIVGSAALGDLQLTGGEIAGSEFADLNMLGALTLSSGEVWAVSALIPGSFVTLDGSGADYITGSTHSGNLTIDGKETESFIYIYAAAD